MKKGEMLDKMLHIAVNAHHGQFDKGGSPYILHPLKVMHYLRSDDEELMCIAIGHDVIEDTHVTYLDMQKAGISMRVQAGIRALTKQPGQTHQEYKETVMNNKDAILVKMADLRHNSDIRRLKGITDKDVARIVKYQTFYAELKEKLKEMQETKETKETND